MKKSKILILSKILLRFLMVVVKDTILVLCYKTSWEDDYPRLLWDSISIRNSFKLLRKL